MLRKAFLFAFLFVAAIINAQEVHLPNINVDITEMMATGHPTKMLSGGYCINLNDDSAQIRLPYIGRVHTPMFGDNRLDFTEPCEDIEIAETKKKDGRKLTFKVRHNSESLRFVLTIYKDASADVYMQPLNADGCNYRGEWTVGEVRESSKVITITRKD